MCRPMCLLTIVERNAFAGVLLLVSRHYPILSPNELQEMTGNLKPTRVQDNQSVDLPLTIRQGSGNKIDKTLSDSLRS